MGQVTVRVNGRQYQVACDDGQENRLSELSIQLDQRIQELLADVGPEVEEQRLLVMVSLLMVDELSAANRLRDADPHRLGNPQDNDRHEESTIADSLEALAARIEAIADKLEAG